MREMIKYELKKIFSNKITIIILIGVLAISILIPFMEMRVEDLTVGSYEFIYGMDAVNKTKEYDTEIKGYMTKEWMENIEYQFDKVKSNPANMEINVYDTEAKKRMLLNEGFSKEEIAKSKALPVMKLKDDVYYDKLAKYDNVRSILYLYNKSYPETIKEIKKKLAADNVSEKTKLKDRYALNVVEDLQANFADFYYDYHLGWDHLLDLICSSGTLYLSIILIIALARIFSEEKTTNMDSIILTSKYGKNKAVLAKLLAGLLFAFFCWSAVMLISVIVTMSIYGVQGYNSAVQINYKCAGVPYQMTMLEFFIASALLNLLGVISLSTIVMYFSSRCRSPFTTIIVSTIFLLIPTIIPSMINNGILRKVFLFTPLNIMSAAETQMGLDLYCIGGKIVRQIPALLTVTSLLIIIFLVFTYRRFKDHQVI